MDRIIFSLEVWGLALFLGLDYTLNTMKYSTKKSLILSICLGLFLTVSPALAEGDTVIFDQTTNTDVCWLSSPEPDTWDTHQTDIDLEIPHLADGENVTLFLTAPFTSEIGSFGTVDVIAFVTTDPSNDVYYSASQEAFFQDENEVILTFEIPNIPDTALINKYSILFSNKSEFMLGIKSFNSNPTDVYTGVNAQSWCLTDFIPADLVIKASFSEPPPPPPPLTLDEAGTGLLVGGLVASFVSQFTDNLPLILAFMAGLAFLLLGIRWVKRSIR